MKVLVFNSFPNIVKSLENVWYYIIRIDYLLYWSKCETRGSDVHYKCIVKWRMWHSSPPPGGALAILCVLGMCRPQGYVFHNFCLGRVLFTAQQSGNGTFFTVSVLEGCCFQAQQSGKGCVLILVWYRNSGKSYNFPCLSGKGENFCLGRVRVYHPGPHTPIHNLVKSPSPPRFKPHALAVLQL